MSVDKFGRHSSKSLAGARGPPGPGFAFTTDGHFDLARKRLKRALSPEEPDDVATKQYVDKNYGVIETILKQNSVLFKAVFTDIDKKILAVKSSLERIINMKTGPMQELLLRTSNDIKDLQGSVNKNQYEAKRVSEEHEKKITAAANHFEELITINIAYVLKQAEEIKNKNDATHKEILERLQIYEKTLKDVVLNLNIIANNVSKPRGGSQ